MKVQDDMRIVKYVCDGCGKETEEFPKWGLDMFLYRGADRSKEFHACSKACARTAVLKAADQMFRATDAA